MTLYVVTHILKTSETDNKGQQMNTKKLMKQKLNRAEMFEFARKHSHNAVTLETLANRQKMKQTVSDFVEAFLGGAVLLFCIGSCISLYFAWEWILA